MADGWRAEESKGEIVLAVLLLLPCVISADDTSTARVDAYLRDQMARQRIPAIAIAVVRDGIVALGVMLVEQGRVSLDRLTVILLANLAQTDPSTLAHGIAVIVDPELAPVEDGQTGK